MKSAHAGYCYGFEVPAEKIIASQVAVQLGAASSDAACSMVQSANNASRQPGVDSALHKTAPTPPVMGTLSQSPKPDLRCGRDIDWSPVRSNAVCSAS